MKRPGKTTLTRMLLAAQREMERIEITQDARVQAGLIEEPMPSQVEARDDFAGIVNLIDIINSDQLILDRLKTRMRDIGLARAARAADAEDLAIDAEAEA